jgi:hypothetical protein
MEKIHSFIHSFIHSKKKLYLCFFLIKIQLCTSKYNYVQANTIMYKQIQSCTSNYNNAQTNTIMYKQIQLWMEKYNSGILTILVIVSVRRKQSSRFYFRKSRWIFGKGIILLFREIRTFCGEVKLPPRNSEESFTFRLSSVYLYGVF